MEFSKSGFFKIWIFQNRKISEKKNWDFQKKGFFKIWIFQNLDSKCELTNKNN